MTRAFDVVIVGTGPAASRIATACAERLRVAVVDSRPIGGGCALRGCNPKKVLVRAAELVDWARRSAGELIAPTEARIDWPRLIAFKRTFTDPVPAKTEERYEKHGIVVLRGTARFAGPNRLTVDGEEVSAERVVLCGGAMPRVLDIPGEDLLTHSDAFMERETLPRRILFVGGGYISFEFAHLARRAGADVRIVEQAERPLGGFEPELVDRLLEHSRELGIEVDTHTSVQAIERRDDGALSAKVLRAGEEVDLAADMIVHGAGRVPAVGELDLGAGDVESDRNGIVVNEFMQSVSNPNVYAAGDIASTDQPKLTPVANQQGRTVAANLLEGNRHTPDYGVVPRVVFTIPSLAAVGMTEDEAREHGREFEVRDGDMSKWGSIRKIGGTCAAYKILVDRETDRLLGAHLVAPHAAETINSFAMAMKFDRTATDLKSVLFAFPTFASDIRSML